MRRKPIPKTNRSICRKPLTGYLVRPVSADTRSETVTKLPGMIVVHENRGLNPHIELGRESLKALLVPLDVEDHIRFDTAELHAMKKSSCFRALIGL